MHRLRHACAGCRTAGAVAGGIGETDETTKENSNTMIYNTKNPFDAEKLVAQVQKDIERGHAVNYTRVRPLRSDKQNSYMWVCLGYFATQYGCSKEEAEVRFFKAHCNKDIFLRQGRMRNGRETTYYRSTKELTTRELSQAIDRFRYWASSEAGIYIPSPNEEQFLLYARQEIERAEEYL